MLKLHIADACFGGTVPAAFGRLCVETPPEAKEEGNQAPAAFGRLCVET